MTALICNADRPEFLEPMPLYVCQTRELCYLGNVVCGEGGICAACEDAEDQHGKRTMMERKKCCRGCWGPYWESSAGRVVCSCDAEPERMAQEDYDNEAEEPTYKEEFCEGCGCEMGGGGSCRDCVYEMDEKFAEKQMKKGRSCTSCGHEVKPTEVGGRCACDRVTDGR